MEPKRMINTLDEDFFFLFLKIIPLQAFLECSPSADVTLHLHTILSLTQLSYFLHSFVFPTKLVHKEVSDICIHLANKEVIKTWKSNLYQVG